MFSLGPHDIGKTNLVVLTVHTETKSEQLSVDQDFVEVVFTIHAETQPELIQHDIAFDNFQIAVITTDELVNGQKSDPVLSKLRQFVALVFEPNPAQKRSIDPEMSHSERRDFILTSGETLYRNEQQASGGHTQHLTTRRVMVNVKASAEPFF
ncbi:hypothetical protein DPMN_072319 [Dreissena polymorpha]|uniref:Uncharacterized protein n=1 Tax=Dreissena polymorpha TaxID=45954 RepID=A0A9D3Z608_DREPO|nr:hypothetical protein DPMN_072319 [Dreissena polymorpha]